MSAKKWVELWDGYKFDGDFIYDRDTNKISRYDIDNVWIHRQLFHLQVCEPNKIKSMKLHLESLLEQARQPIVTSFSYGDEVLKTIEIVPYYNKKLSIRVR